MCSNDTTGTRNILRTTNDRHSKYPEKFNHVKERKKRDRRKYTDEHIATDHQRLNYRDSTVYGSLSSERNSFLY